MDFGLKGKNVLITGSTKGLGKAIAEVAAEEGANVVVSGRKEEEAKALASSIALRFGVKALPVAADLGKVGAAEDLFADALATMGSLDILVNNAGIWPTAYVREMDRAEFERTIYMDLEVPYILCRLMVNHLIPAGRKGKIVNVVSQAAFTAPPRVMPTMRPQRPGSSPSQYPWPARWQGTGSTSTP